MTRDIASGLQGPPLQPGRNCHNSEMSTLPPNPGQAQAIQSVTDEKADRPVHQSSPEGGAGSKYEQNWLRRLSGLPDTAVIDQYCCSSYTLYYSKAIDFLRFLRDPDAVRQEIMLEVVEQLDTTLKVMDEAILERIKRRQQSPAGAKPEQSSAGVNQTVNEIGT